jgi:hypothetical protein
MGASNVVQLPAQSDMEKFLLEVLAKARNGEVLFLSLSYADTDCQVDHRTFGPE